MTGKAGCSDVEKAHGRLTSWRLAFVKGPLFGAYDVRLYIRPFDHPLHQDCWFMFWCIVGLLCICAEALS